jgi:oligoendopeptidase F
MSSSNAAAIRRRVGTQQTDTPAKNTQQSSKNTSQTSSQMTLQQVISTVDKRLNQLEKLAGNSESENNDNNTNNDISDIVTEFNSRFELIVTEINSLKDIVLKLQTFTMDVNKRLLDERIEVLSEVQPNSSLHISSINQEENNTVNFKELVENELK